MTTRPVPALVAKGSIYLNQGTRKGKDRWLSIKYSMLLYRQYKRQSVNQLSFKPGIYQIKNKQPGCLSPVYWLGARNREQDSPSIEARANSSRHTQRLFLFPPYFSSDVASLQRALTARWPRPQYLVSMVIDCCLLVLDFQDALGEVKETALL